jgi:hypothetical protein
LTSTRQAASSAASSDIGIIQSLLETVLLLDGAMRRFEAWISSSLAFVYLAEEKSEKGIADLLSSRGIFCALKNHQNWQKKKSHFCSF